jgi:hypothetical protein
MMTPMLDLKVLVVLMQLEQQTEAVRIRTSGPQMVQTVELPVPVWTALPVVGWSSASLGRLVDLDVGGSWWTFQATGSSTMWMSQRTVLFPL